MIRLKKKGLWFWLMQISSMTYLLFLVLLPLFFLFMTVLLRLGPMNMMRLASTHQALSAIKLTLFLSAIVTLINGFAGTMSAWYLVKHQFWGKTILNTLIDLPFAIPTVVTGMILVWFYGPQGLIGGVLAGFDIEILFAKPGMLLALLFITFPLTIRAVQPLVIELDEEMCEAALTLGAQDGLIFRRIVFPQLRPGIITGMALTFARSMGEFGALIVIAGNIPFRTQVASVYIFGEVESGQMDSALSVAALMLLLSVGVLLLLGFLERGRKK